MERELTLYCPLKLNLPGIGGIILRFELPVDLTKQKKRGGGGSGNVLYFPSRSL